MARDLKRRPPLRASMLPPHKVSVRPGEPRMIACPGCDRWLSPSNGGLRRHMVDVDSTVVCPESGRRVWFDLAPVVHAALLKVAVLDAGLRRSVQVRRKPSLEVPLPVFRMAAAR